MQEIDKRDLALHICGGDQPPCCDFTVLPFHRINLTPAVKGECWREQGVGHLMIVEDEAFNFEALRDCLSTTVIEKLAPSGKQRKKVKGRKNEIKPVAGIEPIGDCGTDAADLSDFTEVVFTMSTHRLSADRSPSILPKRSF